MGFEEGSRFFHARHELDPFSFAIGDNLGVSYVDGIGRLDIHDARRRQRVSQFVDFSAGGVA